MKFCRPEKLENSRCATCFIGRRNRGRDNNNNKNRSSKDRMDQPTTAREMLLARWMVMVVGSMWTERATRGLGSPGEEEEEEGEDG